LTCIAGYIENGQVYMGADSAGAAGWNIVDRKDEKVFQNGDFLIGFTTSFRMGQLLRYKLNPPSHPEGMCPFEYMATIFVDAVRQTLTAGGYATKINEVETGGAFLIGYKGRLFCIHDDYQVEELFEPYNAVGCGKPYAMAAFSSTQNFDLSPEKRVFLALEAAEKWSNGVRRPFLILQTSGPPLTICPK
jgi:ATP-dependent protease HslVU (ClpYQ) peptidase subunit